MSEDPKTYLDRKISELTGVGKKTAADGQEAYFRGNVEFARWNGSRIRLTVTEECRAKIGQALASDPRATVVTSRPELVDLNVSSEIDVELVFVYIRYAWKFAL